MSAETSGDVSLISDEDVLRKMWQNTEDFGRKKEIRAHMYKLRESRLRDFYNAGEMSSETKSSTTKTTKSSTTSEKLCDVPTHADSLADHSFLSMKSKEIRDSESPTRDINYRITDKSHDHGWNVISSNTLSNDGKTQVSNKLATTSGSKRIDGGQIDYVAKTQQESSVYQDGDDKNYTKALGASSNSTIKQQASGGDENSNFKMSSTKTTSSSKIVSEQHHSSDGNQNFQTITQPSQNQEVVTRKVFTNDTPNELKNHPSYIDGKTKVTRETRTLPDGSVVTTTKYETKGGNAMQTSSSSSSSTEQRSATTKSHSSSAQSHSSSKVVQGSNLIDHSKATSNEKIVSSQSHDIQNYCQDVPKTLDSSQTTVTRYVGNGSANVAENRSIDVQVQKQSNFSSSNQSQKQSNRITNDEKNFATHSSHVQDYQHIPQNLENIQALTKTTATKYIDNDKKFDQGNIDIQISHQSSLGKNKEVRHYNQKSTDNRQQISDTPLNKYVDETPIPKTSQSPIKPAEKYGLPEKRQPIKPGKSEMDQKCEPTEGQYDTTYRSEFTNKRISVELSPTHDAFARSLRAVSPDRISKASSPSINSLRSSTSPEKIRLSPDRRSRERSISPKKVDRFASNETINKYQKTDNRKNKEIDSSTLTRKSKVTKRTRSRSPSPTSIASDIEFIRNTDHLVTDLDTNKTIVTKKPDSRPSSLEITRKAKKVTERSPTSPLNDLSPKRSPTKDTATSRRSSLRNTSPSEKPLKRTDTYEERCKEILGLSKNVKADQKQITTIKKDKIRKSPEKEHLAKYPEKKEAPKIREFPSQTRESPEKQSLGKYPEKSKPKDVVAPKIQEFPSQMRKSPEKEQLAEYPQKFKSKESSPKISEFPSQIRKSPDRQVLEKPPERKSPAKEALKICEFPSQIRKSPERETLEKYPEKTQPIKSAPKIQEFPSQIRKSPEREPIGEYPVKVKPKKDAPKIGEFPSQIRKSPEREILGEYPEKRKPTKEAPKIQEFPSQIRKSPDRESLGNYPEKCKPTKEAPTVQEFPSQIRKSPERQPLEKYPEKDHQVEEAPKIDEFPSQIRKSPERSATPEKIRPIITTPSGKPKKKKGDKKRTTSSSSETEEETDDIKIEDITTSKKITDLYEGKSPVDEPLATKKFISLLCREEELQRDLTTKKNAKNLLDSEILKSDIKKVNKTVKKDSAGKFIENERKSTIPKKPEQPREKSPSKKVQNKTTTNLDVTTKKSVIDLKSTKKESLKPKELATITKKKTTLYDIEKLNKNQELNKIHIRTHRIDDTLTKKKTQETITKRPITKVEEPKKKITPKKHVVTATITVSPKSKPATQTKLQNGHVSSDESAVEHLVETTKKITRTTSDQVIKTARKTLPTRGSSKPELISPAKKESKKCITTKSIIINNDDDKKEIIVDLQRSTSSREPTPDRVCPLPIFSTEETGTPRYPDQIVEPDEDSLKRKPKKLSDIPILESESTEEFSRITEVNRIEENDESLLSVDKKISKFLNTADKMTTKKPEGPAPKVDRPNLVVDENLKSDECLLSVSEKVNRFITTAEQLTSPGQLPDRPKSPKCQYFRRNSDQVDENTKNDDCLLSVSDKVSKFTTTAEKSNQPVSLSKLDIKPKAPIEVEQHVHTRRSSLKRSSPSPEEKTPNRRPSNQYASIKNMDHQESKYREGSPKLPDSTPKSSRKLSTDETKSILSPTGRLRSTESIKRAKALFENITKESESILTRTKLSYSSEDDEQTAKLKSTRLVMEKMRHKSKSPEPRQTRSRSATPDGDVPGYMRPLDRSLRAKSPHRDSINQLNIKYPGLSDDEEDQGKTTKFGVTLKRTDSSKATTTTTTTNLERKKSDLSTRKNITESEIEEIYELDILEELLEHVVGYDLRRKIRAQIRLVKKLISENKLEATKRRSSNKIDAATRKTEYQTKYTKKSGSPERHVTHNKLFKHTDLIGNRENVEEKSEYQSSYSYKSSSDYSRKSRSRSPDVKTNGKKSPSWEKLQTRSSPERKLYHQTQLKKATPSGKTTTIDDKPEWVRERNLRKTSETIKKTSTISSSSKKEATRRSPSPLKDPVISSYGVGPTDEHGTPLFGLKALRTKNKSDTTKVQGTVVRSQYYSENGNEPIGEISITKYSTDPKDLGNKRGSVDSKGVTSVTTTQKFGYKNTPTLKSLDKKSIENESTKSKVTRRGSVKALSQKFINNAVETSKSERQSTYPKAGLILRTSSFKESTSSGTDRSRESSPGKQRSPVRKSQAKSEQSSSSSVTIKGESFLTNRSRVTGVQDVLNRMTAEDVVEGDTVEDIEARGLLNKFLGAQVILSGFEKENTRGSTTTQSSSSSTRRTTTKVTTTVLEGGKKTSRTRIYQHPITTKELDSIWDEQTVRILLEQSSDYEERKKLRAKLRQIMAEQEACTDLVDKASSEEQTSGTIEETVETRKSVSTGPVTTTQVTTRVATTQQSNRVKPMSPFAKFRQLDKQNSFNTPPSTPKTPSGSGILFKFTDPAVNQSASTVKDRLLHWCRMKTKEYENIQLDNFSTSWADGLGFCALIHHFLPDAFDYHALTPKNRRHNFTLAFQVADEKADIAPLLDVDDMVATRKPDWKCVFTYVQSIYRRFKDED